MDERCRRAYVFYDRLMRSRPEQPSRKSIPARCEDCVYYQPKFRFRTCSFARCVYGMTDRKVFREHPLKKELIVKNSRSGNCGNAGRKANSVTPICRKEETGHA